MRIALVHDYLTRSGGAEKVLATLAELWSEAPVFTSVRKPNTKYDIRNTIYTSCWQKLPSGLRTSKLLVPVYPLIFENFDLSEFDIVISSGYFAKGILTTPEQLHINYCHTVPRFLYGYSTETRIRRNPFGKVITAPIDHKLRVWDFYSAQRPDFVVANSKTVAARIKKLWNREATVIYPPVEFSKKKRPNTKCEIPDARYFLVVSRLEPYKNVDLAIETCNNLNLPLKVVGEGSEKKRLRRLAGPTIELLGRVSAERLAELYTGCRALIFPAQDEDFGLVPVEAMGFGKPAIALAGGGVTETVVENETGLFFDGPTTDSLTKVTQAFNDLNYFHSEACRKRCIAQAQRFSKGRFKKEFREFVEQQWRKRI